MNDDGNFMFKTLSSSSLIIHYGIKCCFGKFSCKITSSSLLAGNLLLTCNEKTFGEYFAVEMSGEWEKEFDITTPLLLQFYCKMEWKYFYATCTYLLRILEGEMVQVNVKVALYNILSKFGDLFWDSWCLESKNYQKICLWAISLTRSRPLKALKFIFGLFWGF